MGGGGGRRGAAAAAAGCAGGASQARQASRGVADVGQDRPRQSLTGTEWQLTQVVEASRTWRPPPYEDAVLRFDGEATSAHTSATTWAARSGSTATSCTSGGRWAPRWDVAGPGGPLRGCSSPRCAVRCAGGSTGAELCLDQPDGRGLRFGVRDSIYPTRELPR
jgi:hypothetical protein